MIHFLKLIRYKNLLLIALIQYVIKYVFLNSFTESHGVITTLRPFHFFLFVSSTLCIAAGGYIINAIYSIETDVINKPNAIIINKTITEKNGFTMFIVLNVIGVFLGFYLSYYVNKPSFFILFFACSALLYVYASALKQMLIIGNAIIAIVNALVVLSVGIFELLPAITFHNQNIQLLFFNIIRDYSIFIFLVSFLNELVKDIRDIDGDFETEMQTLPIVLGKKRTTKMAFFFVLVILCSIIYYLITYLYTQQLIISYFLILVIAPLIYSSIKLFNATQKNHYRHINMLLNLILLTGLFSLVLYKYVII